MLITNYAGDSVFLTDTLSVYTCIVLLSQILIDLMYIAVIADFGRDPAYTICCGVTNDYF